MSNLIDRQAAIEVADAVWVVTGDKNVAKVWDQIKDLPSAQPDYRTDHGYMWLCPECGLPVHSDFVKCVRCGFVRHDTQPKIVRCNECKHYYFADNRIPQEQMYTCELDGDRWEPDDYCSFAERRTDG